jgi:hypothetical protein
LFPVTVRSPHEGGRGGRRWRSGAEASLFAESGGQPDQTTPSHLSLRCHLSQRSRSLHLGLPPLQIGNPPLGTLAGRVSQDVGFLSLA